MTGAGHVRRRTWRAAGRRRVALRPIASSDVVCRDACTGTWESVGRCPLLELVSPGSPLPTSWVRISFEMERDGRFDRDAVLQLDTGAGYDAGPCVPLPPPRTGRVRTIAALPPSVKGIRFSPMAGEGVFRLGCLSMQELGRVEVGAAVALRVATRVLAEPLRLPRHVGRAVAAARAGGLRQLKDLLVAGGEVAGAEDPYASWITRFDALDADDRAAILARIDGLAWRPTISVVMPVYDPPERWLRAAIESVLGQLYPNWELCIADDASRAPHIRRVLEEYTARDLRVRVVFRGRTGHIAAASNSALALAGGEFVALLDHDDVLAPHALYLVAEELNAQPNADVIYSDEDKLDEAGRRYEPHFKPDWNPDLLGSQNYVSHLGVYRAALVRRVGGFRTGFDGSQDYDLLLRCVAASTADRMRHVPFVLYHWRAARGSTAIDVAAKEYAQDAAERALREHYARLDPGIRITGARFPTTYRVRYPLPDPPPLVTIIIPTRDGLRVLEPCIEGVLTRTDYRALEIVVVDNQSREAETLRYLARLAARPGVRVVRYDRAFNYSAINNLGVAAATGTVICLLNSDVEVLAREWLAEMVAHALRSDVGAVGAKLVYPDDTIQHAGIVTGIAGFAGHVHRFVRRDAQGWFSRPQLVRNVSAVTGACLVVRRELYERVGGFDEEHLAVSLNDVDFCLKLVAAGFRNVWTPYAELRHHESFSRGAEDTPEKRQRFAREIAWLGQRWGLRLDEDPYHNPNLSLSTEQPTLAWPPRVRRPWRAPVVVQAPA